MNPAFPPDVFDDPDRLAESLRNAGLSLKRSEAQQIRERLGRVPTLAELFVFDIEWSEHCSYKSSKALLKKYLPTDGPFVIQGPEEDAGVVEFAVHNGARYGIVIAHESHNHPSQVLPFEGAATGIGGIVRDVDCMGADVVGVADPLRFGDPKGPNAARVKSIARGVVEGIWHYGNALGVPNLGGDVVFHEGFDDNCLVNVVAVGLLREDEIIHSRVPGGGEGYDLILAGKPTDRSGFGGASFSSATLDQDAEEENKGAVQIPDPFLKNVLLHYKATSAVRKRARECGVPVGMKDLGAGGIACCASEIGASGGMGVELFLDGVHVEEEGLPPEIVLCAETQERYIWAVPPSFTPEVLKIYNEDWDLPNICSGAGARVIGKVIAEPAMRVYHNNQLVVDLPIDFVTGGVRYDREAREPQTAFSDPRPEPPSDWNELLLDMLASPNIASKEWIYRHYDTEVQGNAVIRPGEAGASLIAPLEGCPAGMALSVDGNPFLGEISPYWGAANAVAEAMRNVASVGATPYAMTDCLNYGNPEIPEHFWALEQGVMGLSDAARNLYNPADPEKSPVPFVSGNVSLYNHSASGKSVPPSPIVACVGVIRDASKAVTGEIKETGNLIVLAGPRRGELGGSEYYRNLGLGPGANVPKVVYEEERGIVYGTIEAIDRGLVRSANDISNGGLLISAAEMLLAAHPRQPVGIQLLLSALHSDLEDDVLLFSENGGMVLEVRTGDYEALKSVFEAHGLEAPAIGETIAEPRLIVHGGARDTLIDVPIEKMREAWRGPCGLTLAS